MRMSAVAFSGLVKRNILKTLNERLSHKVEEYSINLRDRLHHSDFIFQLEPSIAKNPVFAGLPDSIEESITLHYETWVISTLELSGCKVENLRIYFQLFVPGRPPVELYIETRMDAIPSMSPQDAFDIAQTAIREMLATAKPSAPEWVGPIPRPKD